MTKDGRPVLPAPPSRVLDVGGGTGVHARRLVARGYRVHLIDVVPDHVDQARRTQPGTDSPTAPLCATPGI